MEKQEQQQKEQKFFCDLAAALANGKLTPEHACYMIETARHAKIFPDDILEPENQSQEQQKGFNEIAGVFADWKITKEEACELFVEWIQEQQKGFNEIVEVFPDWKITNEEACELFVEWIDEWKKDATLTPTLTVSTHAPGIKLTDEERAEKVVKHKYGLCCSCDTGLDCCTDFILYHHPSGVYALYMCVACNRYYADTGTEFDFDNFMNR
jgi:hypothetical protein